VNPAAVNAASCYESHFIAEIVTHITKNKSTGEEMSIVKGGRERKGESRNDIQGKGIRNELRTRSSGKI
jgi:hypothetical protein